jgi:hypothetical protein
MDEIKGQVPLSDIIIIGRVPLSGEMKGRVPLSDEKKVETSDEIYS